MTDDKTLTEMAKNAGRTLLDRLNTSIVDFGIADDLKVCKAHSDESNVNVRITPGVLLGGALIIGVMSLGGNGVGPGPASKTERILFAAAKDAGLSDEDARAETDRVMWRLHPFYMYRKGRQ